MLNENGFSMISTYFALHSCEIASKKLYYNLPSSIFQPVGCISNSVSIFIKQRRKGLGIVQVCVSPAGLIMSFFFEGGCEDADGVGLRDVTERHQRIGVVKMVLEGSIWEGSRRIKIY